MTTKAQQAEQDRDEARGYLRGFVAQGDTAWTVLRHVSASGMSRSISLVLVHDGEPQDVSHLVARAIGRKIHRTRYGIACNGAGMDMGFDLVYTLSVALFEDGYALRHRWL